MCKGNLTVIKEAMVLARGERKPNLMYMAECALIFHFVTIEHIPIAGTDLIGFVSRECLSGMPSPSIRASYRASDVF